MIHDGLLNAVHIGGYIETIESSKPSPNSTRVRAILWHPHPKKDKWDVRTTVIGHGKSANALLEAAEKGCVVMIEGSLAHTCEGSTEAVVLVSRVRRTV